MPMDIKTPRMQRKSDFVCLYCGEPTTEDEDDPTKKPARSKEHVFPHSIGGNTTLEVGDVCDECNHRLGELDQALKYDDLNMAYTYQFDDSKRGRQRDEKSKERHREEKKKISVSNGSTVEYNKENRKTTFTNLGVVKYNDLFVRALHKCAANVLCGQFGSKKTRSYCPELIDFVNTGNDARSWSYAVSYQGLWPTIRCRPHSLHIALDNDGPIALSFADTSGIYLVDTRPNMLSRKIILHMSEYIVNQDWGDAYSSEQRPKAKLADHFGCVFFTANRTLIGDLRFMWVKKHLKPERRLDGFLRVLVECKTCGQINHAGSSVGCRELLDTKDSARVVRGRDNDGWNRLTIDDLKRRGVRTEALSREELERMMGGRIDYPAENKDKLMCIPRGSVQCICCRERVDYVRDECFL